MGNVQNYIKETLTSEFKLTELTGDAGSRQYFKIDTDSKENYVLCVYKKNELTSFKNFLNVNSLFSGGGIKTPRIVSSDSNLGLMILEDLGEKTLETEYQKSADLNWYHLAIDELVKIQDLKPLPKSTAHSYQFTIEKFVWELHFAVEHLTKLYKIEADSVDLEILTYEFNDISTHLVSLPQVVTHRDYHSRNILIKDETLYIIDFQDARLGNSFYDLVSLIEDSYTNLKEKISLIDYYKCSSTLGSKLNLDNEAFNFNYNTQAVQRTFKACGSFASLKNLKKMDRYLPYLGPCFKNLQIYLKDLNRHPELLKFIQACSKEEASRTAERPL